jgi:hypothetical protein
MVTLSMHFKKLPGVFHVFYFLVIAHFDKDDVGRLILTKLAGIVCNDILTDRFQMNFV